MASSCYEQALVRCPISSNCHYGCLLRPQPAPPAQWSVFWQPESDGDLHMDDLCLRISCSNQWHQLGTMNLPSKLHGSSWTVCEATGLGIYIYIYEYPEQERKSSKHVANQH